MHYTKALVDLIQEARRRAPSEDKPSIKLANPDVLFELLRLYQKSSDAVFKALVKEIFSQAGDPWPARLEKAPKEAGPDEVPEGYVVKVYRGQRILERRDKSSANADKKETDRPKRMYRGQAIS
jgi:hypothetical protein